VFGDAVSVKFVNTRFFIVTCETINVLRGCLIFVLVVKVMLSLFSRVNLAENKVNASTVNCDVLLCCGTELNTRQTVLPSQLASYFENKVFFSGKTLQNICYVA
jgi:hypothetical protein